MAAEKSVFLLALLANGKGFWHVGCLDAIRLHYPFARSISNTPAKRACFGDSSNCVQTVPVALGLGWSKSPYAAAWTNSRWKGMSSAFGSLQVPATS